MNIRMLQICIFIITSLIIGTMLSGCVEVTPPSGEQEVSAYGPSSTGGDLKDLAKGENTDEINQKDNIKQDTGDLTKPTEQPVTVLPGVENGSFVKVVPRNYEELRSDTQISYLPYNRPVFTEDRQYITIQEMKNQSFSNNASAYAYELKTPPLYIDLNFYPKIVTDEQEIYKRTGDKEGTITFTKTRPSQDAWFEMRVYDLNTNQEILREGYGKTYSLTNKSTVIRRAGHFQFDFMGDFMNADISMKIPVDSSTIENYTHVNTIIEDQKIKSGLLPDIFLKIVDLGPSWQQTGRLIHSPDTYSVIFVNPVSGSKIAQDIKKYSNNDVAKSHYSETKSKNSGEIQTSIIAGDEGYGFESVRKTGIVFAQGEYVVELTSFSVPPVSLDELKKYASLISGRINSH